MARNRSNQERVPIAVEPDRQSDRLLTPDDLAKHFGVPKATLYRWRYERQGPPALKVGRHLRYRRDDVDAWVQSRVEARQ